MRLHRLELVGVGPFRAPQSVDFDALSASGLFLIEGPTGAGKSTLIDAIVFALYGDVSGKSSDTGRIRSHLCGPDEPTEVILEFSISGVRHRIRRSPSYERTKARGSGTTSERARQTLEVLEGDIPPMRDARDIAIYLLQRLGLSAEHFRQLVVLPQGEFDALLRASPRGRFEVLGSLIDDGFLARVQDDLRIQADYARERRAEADEQIEHLVALMAARAREVVDLADDDQTTLDAAALIEHVTREATVAAQEAQALSAPAARAREHASDAARACAAATAAAESRLALDRALAAVEPDDRAHSDPRELLTGLISHRTRLDPLAAWESTETERDAEVARLRADSDLADATLDVARQAEVTLPQRREALAARLLEAGLTAERVASITGDVHLLEQRLADLDQRTLLEGRLVADVSASDVAATSLQAARARLHVLRVAQLDLARRQLDQRAAHLASMLVTGAPCPVCGAAEHPAPALPDSEEALISDADVADAQSSVASAETAEQSADRLARDLLSTAAETRSALALVVDRAGDATRAGVEEALASSRLSLVAAQAAADSLAALQAESASLQSEAETARTVVERATAAAQSARAMVEARILADDQQRERLRSEIGDAASATDLQTRIDARINALETLERVRSDVAGLPVDVDLAGAAARLAEAQSAQATAESAFNAAEQRRLRLADALAVLRGYLADLAAAQAVLDSVGHDTEAAIALGDLVTARSPANTRHLTLQSYAVQRRFRAVLEAASVHLERMSSGHYILELDEEVGRGQTGLGISVRDAWTGQVRDPATLSGGETFYASLSLALGLADVVREETGGIDLETLFVDEGFGSLDADTLQLVLDQLDALRSRGRVVGVISHVADMRDWVRDRIEVVPGPEPGSGSRLSPAATSSLFP